MQKILLQSTLLLRLPPTDNLISREIDLGACRLCLGCKLLLELVFAKDDPPTHIIGWRTKLYCFQMVIAIEYITKGFMVRQDKLTKNGREHASIVWLLEDS